MEKFEDVILLIQADQNKKLDKIEEKFDTLHDILNKTNQILAAQQQSLCDHIRRTEILEEQVLPLKEDSDRVKGALKFLGVLGAGAGIAVTIFELLPYLAKLF